MLLKAWFALEVGRSVNGSASSSCAFPTAAVEVMLMWIFNWAGQFISYPAQALDYFLSYFSTFDWSMWALTVFGPVRSADLVDDLSLRDVKRLPVVDHEDEGVVEDNAAGSGS